MKTILCIEDNPEMQILVEASLDSYQLLQATTLTEARRFLESDKVDLIILDLELPDGDGLKFLTQLGEKDAKLKEIPVFILTGKSETANKVIAFSLGADDFIAKPFDPLELRARVAAKIKKSEVSQEKREVIKFKDLLIDIPRQRVQLLHAGSAQNIQVTSLEFKLLVNFVRAPDRVFSRDQLLDHVWGSGTNITDRTVDTHVGHLRKKLAASLVKIETVINEGYRLLP
jgi:DNA-binding response OmpR family regulator